MQCSAVYKSGDKKGKGCTSAAKFITADENKFCGVHARGKSCIPWQPPGEKIDWPDQNEEVTWKELNLRRTPKWFLSEASNLGAIIHWGIYSVPAFHQLPKSASSKGICNGSEWYWRRLHNSGLYGPATRDFHNENYPGVSYQDFAEDFTAERWKPDQWAKMFKEAGFGYVVLTAKHHDGFTLWPSSVNGTEKEGWSVERDLVGQLATAVRKQGLKFGIYYSWMEWFAPLYLNDKRNLKKGQPTRRFLGEIALPQLRELVKNYLPDFIFFDGDWEMPTEYWGAKEFLDWLYNESPVAKTVVVNDRLGKGANHATVRNVQDRYLPKTEPNFLWQCVATIGNSWGFNLEEQEDDFKSPEEIRQMLKSVTDKNGKLLLNFGPDAEGRLRKEELRILKGLAMVAVEE